jgi:hypothetical protein
MKVIGLLFSPIAFGIGLLAPLIAQIMAFAGLSVVGIPDIWVGLFISAQLGLIAHLRGSWVWVKP